MREAKFQAKEVGVTFRSQGAQLVGVHHKVDSPSMVIMCHGFTSTKVEDKRLFVEAARDFASHGCNAFRFDFFGSGDSEGEFQDSLISRNIENLRDAISWARASGYARLALLGISLGAATAILTAADTPVDALITWSAVPDLQLLYKNRAGELVPHQDSLIEYDGWLLKPAFFAQASDYDIQSCLAKITAPKLVVQGTADDALFIDGFQQFRKIVQPPADFMEIPGAGHTFASPAHRRQVIIQTSHWLQRHL
ncbi:alpha/beta fold hydrolase [candidate division KSB1 bacterium]|nr:alpha/beta fold hydrolase [candidate division KSB1 bacterium]RQW11392.1 MAG: alpha/beta fold hydrolase [candidate division KSB1 bacterium]